MCGETIIIVLQVEVCVAGGFAKKAAGPPGIKNDLYCRAMYNTSNYSAMVANLI